MDDYPNEDRERLWICVARLGLLQQLGLGTSGELVESLRALIAQLDPRPAEEILAALREVDGFRAFEESERERYAQQATASETGRALLLRTLASDVAITRVAGTVQPDIERATPQQGPSTAGRAGRAWHQDPSRKSRRKAARASRRKNRS